MDQSSCISLLKQEIEVWKMSGTLSAESLHQRLDGILARLKREVQIESKRGDRLQEDANRRQRESSHRPSDARSHNLELQLDDVHNGGTVSAILQEDIVTRAEVDNAPTCQGSSIFSNLNPNGRTLGRI